MWDNTEGTVKQGNKISYKVGVLNYDKDCRCMLESSSSIFN